METAVATATAKSHTFFQEFLWKGCQLWTQISQLLIGQIEIFLSLSDREFPEYFKTHPTFVPGHFQNGVISKMPKTCFFFGTPCISPRPLLLSPEKTMVSKGLK